MKQATYKNGIRIIESQQGYSYSYENTEKLSYISDVIAKLTQIQEQYGNIVLVSEFDSDDYGVFDPSLIKVIIPGNKEITIPEKVRFGEAMLSFPGY